LGFNKINIFYLAIGIFYSLSTFFLIFKLRFPSFVLMKLRYQNRIANTSDMTTYLLVGIIVVTVLLGAVKILFF